MSISVPDLKCWVQFKGCQLGCFGLFLWLPTLGWEFLESRGRALFTFKLSQSLEQYLTQRGISTFLTSCSSLSNSKSAFNFCFGIFYLSLFPPSPLRYASLCKHLWWCITLIQNGKDNAETLSLSLPSGTHPIQEISLLGFSLSHRGNSEFPFFYFYCPVPISHTSPCSQWTYEDEGRENGLSVVFDLWGPSEQLSPFYVKVFK